MKQYHVTGERVVASGACLSRNADGKITFVHGLLPGEHATVRDSSTKGSVSFADIVTLDSASQFRVAPPCTYVDQGCGGCDWQHIDIGYQSELKRGIVVDALARIGKFADADILVSPTVEMAHRDYRTSARVLVNGSSWGFRSRHSHEMISVNECMVLHAECEMQARDIQETLHGSDVHEAHLRRMPDVFHGVRLKVSPGSFYQSHIDAADVLTDMVTDIAQRNHVHTAADLYSGVGIFSLALGVHGVSVISIEGNPVAVADAMINLADVDADVIECDVDHFDFAEQNLLGSCDLVVADPSRDGLKSGGVAAVLSCDADTVALVSCDPASGARDIALLCDSDYDIVSITPIDMFPHTHHVEMVTELRRVRG